MNKVVILHQLVEEKTEEFEKRIEKELNDVTKPKRIAEDKISFTHILGGRQICNIIYTFMDWDTEKES